MEKNASGHISPRTYSFGSSHSQIWQHHPTRSVRASAINRFPGPRTFSVALVVRLRRHSSAARRRQGKRLDQQHRFRISRANRLRTFTAWQSAIDAFAETQHRKSARRPDHVAESTVVVSASKPIDFAARHSAAAAHQRSGHTFDRPSAKCAVVAEYPRTTSPRIGVGLVKQQLPAVAGNGGGQKRSANVHTKYSE